jgi:hypothetical protein
MGATALLASAASAAPLNPTAVGKPEASNIEQLLAHRRSSLRLPKLQQRLPQL